MEGVWCQIVMCVLYPQILCIYDALSEIDLELVAKFVSGLQQPDGSFFGDKWGEVDTRFSFCAVAVLSLIVSERVGKRMILNTKSIKRSLTL